MTTLRTHPKHFCPRPLMKSQLLPPIMCPAEHRRNKTALHLSIDIIGNTDRRLRKVARNLYRLRGTVRCFALPVLSELGSVHWRHQEADPVMEIHGWDELTDFTKRDQKEGKQAALDTLALRIQWRCRKQYDLKLSQRGDVIFPFVYLFSTLHGWKMTPDLGKTSSTRCCLHLSQKVKKMIKS